MRPAPKTPTKVCRELGRLHWAVIHITAQMSPGHMGTQIQLWEGRLGTVSQRKQTSHGLPAIHLVPTSPLISATPNYKLCVNSSCSLGAF